jgi:hypothetical protein
LPGSGSCKRKGNQPARTFRSREGDDKAGCLHLNVDAGVTDTLRTYARLKVVTQGQVVEEALRQYFESKERTESKA